ncbi:MAG TPA: hypothetical protein VGY56_21620 [Verrucomicrobiae bacterium]|nr:hypothetical protein [Verrucomicrobiae bacterium]
MPELTRTSQTHGYCFDHSSAGTALPVAQWQLVRTNSFDSNGDFSFTNNLGSNPAEFYLLKLQ